jgi:hypothetical protein
MHALRFILIAISISMFAALGWRAVNPPRPPARIEQPQPKVVIQPEIQPGAFDTLDRARGAVEDVIALDGDFEPFFSSLRDNFASDYNALIERFGQRAFERKQTESVDYYMSESIRALRHARGLLAAQAENLLLDRIFIMQAAVIDALAVKDARVCADFIYGAASEGFFAFSESHRPLIAEMALANLAAIIDGSTSKIVRLTPGDEEFQQLEEALAAEGLTQVEIDALVDGKAPDPPLPDGRMCAAGVTYLKVISALPESARVRLEALMVELMART